MVNNKTYTKMKQYFENVWDCTVKGSDLVILLVLLAILGSIGVFAHMPIVFKIMGCLILFWIVTPFVVSIPWKLPFRDKSQTGIYIGLCITGVAAIGLFILSMVLCLPALEITIFAFILIVNLIALFTI